MHSFVYFYKCRYINVFSGCGRVCVWCVCALYWRTHSFPVSAWHQRVSRVAPAAHHLLNLPMTSADPVLGGVSVCQLQPTATHTGLSILTMGVTTVNDGLCGSLTEPVNATQTLLDLTVADAVTGWQDRTVIKESQWVRMKHLFTHTWTMASFQGFTLICLSCLTW